MNVEKPTIGHEGMGHVLDCRVKDVFGIIVCLSSRSVGQGSSPVEGMILGIPYKGQKQDRWTVHYSISAVRHTYVRSSPDRRLETVLHHNYL